ncbi:kynurenine formamidase [Halolactibacillus alkaliphilus]|uniref:Kynurenine formamidase n=1 Tax=Halolactibacillus alkaliphilus TaxID=442899 RepID=A0A511WXK6_9BACI|nr:cyclase family protein [Halolactibacillus alkaliphilus]GEN55855.1 kynurenine formamidase [Halolactibacillus alkaliphilus]GGN65905.1 kynurenine formamidase [Halolactibacillus alkaliphilus]SFO66442.1 Kynurenine formamidase [Halolactibacillus alkaliphilus]
MHYIDITMPLINEGAVWPGDTPFHFKLSATMKETNAVNIGEMSLSLHNGTHMDAPFHYDEHGATIDQVNLSIGIGRCQIIDVTHLEKVTESDLKCFDFNNTPRVLFHMLDRAPTIFPEQFPLLTEDAVNYLSKQGVKLIGTDAPSVDEVTSKTLPIHQALHASNMTIIENLFLNHVAPGVYWLYAVPLKIIGADASPIRAILTPLDGEVY